MILINAFFITLLSAVPQRNTYSIINSINSGNYDRPSFTFIEKRLRKELHGISSLKLTLNINCYKDIEDNSYVQWFLYYAQIPIVINTFLESVGSFKKDKIDFENIPEHHVVVTEMRHVPTIVRHLVRPNGVYFFVFYERSLNFTKLHELQRMMWI